MADLSRNRWPVIFGTGGRNPSEQVAEFIGIGILPIFMVNSLSILKKTAFFLLFYGYGFVTLKCSVWVRFRMCVWVRFRMLLLFKCHMDNRFSSFFRFTESTLNKVFNSFLEYSIRPPETPFFRYCINRFILFVSTPLISNF